jgi:hypothetical protein
MKAHMTISQPIHPLFFPSLFNRRSNSIRPASEYDQIANKIMVMLDKIKPTARLTRKNSFQEQVGSTILKHYGLINPLQSDIHHASYLANSSGFEET